MKRIIHDEDYLLHVKITSLHEFDGYVRDFAEFHSFEVEPVVDFNRVQWRCVYGTHNVRCNWNIQVSLGTNFLIESFDLGHNHPTEYFTVSNDIPKTEDQASLDMSERETPSCMTENATLNCEDFIPLPYRKAYPIIRNILDFSSGQICDSMLWLEDKILKISKKWGFEVKKYTENDKFLQYCCGFSNDENNCPWRVKVETISLSHSLDKEQKQIVYLVTSMKDLHTHDLHEC
jgi:hypothetical protein